MAATTTKEFKVEYVSSVRAPLATQLVSAMIKKTGIRVSAFSSVLPTTSQAGPVSLIPITNSNEQTTHGDDISVAIALATQAGLTPLPTQEWIDFSRSLSTTAATTNTDELLSKLGSTLTKEHPTLSGTPANGVADIIVMAYLHRSGKFDMKTHAKKYPTIAKWFQALKHNPEFKQIWSADETASSSTAETSLAGSKGKFDLVDVPEGMIVTTRFPPEPSGFLHIGHIKAALLNEYFAHIKYKGKLIVRFDDTNPKKEKPEFYQSILGDLRLVGIIPDVVTYTSDYFDTLFGYAERLIKEGNGYVDDAPREVVSEGRANGTETPCRSNSVQKNLEMWEQMKAGTEFGQKCVLRAKIDMQHKNRVLRDPAMYRCLVGHTHLRTGDKYKVYPLYDFSIPIVDSLEGVTHALRSSEYHDRNQLYDWVVDIFKLRKPVIEDFSRLNFGYVLLSKRKLQWFVDSQIVENWEDPRFPTVRGLLRRGLTVEAMREFVQSQGSSKALNMMDMDKLWVINKRIIDPQVPRLTVIEDAPKCRVKLTGTDAPEKPTVRTDIPKHRKNPALGMKTIWYSSEFFLEGEDAQELAVNEEVTLMEWGNCVIDSLERDAQNRVVGASAHLHLAGNIKETKKKLTWLSTSAPLVQVDIVEYDHLISVAKLAEGQDFEKFVRPVSKVITRVIGCSEIGSLHVGDRMQLERRGYFICDAVPTAPGQPVTLVLIPDGTNHKMLGQKILLQWSAQ